MSPLSTAKTLYQKIWDRHVVAHDPGSPAILYIDRHLIHEVTSPQAFSGLKDRDLPLRRPDKTFGTIDHSIPTTDRSLPIADPQAKAQIETLIQNCHETGVTLYDLDSGKQGIIHVMGPEQGLTLPGMTIVCGDSHTATHGAFGALAFGIGTSEIEHVFATQCLLQQPSKTMSITMNGSLKPYVTPKDVILAIIAQIGVDGGTGYVLEYQGSVFDAMSMEGRMTVCNMSIEAGARAGMVAPDATTIEYLRDKLHAPKGEAFDTAAEDWLSLRSDTGAIYDASVVLDGNAIEPMVTFGTHPGMATGISQDVPSPDDLTNVDEQSQMSDALQYMQLDAGRPLQGTKMDVVFIGSCTNSRIEDLRSAAQVVSKQGKRVASGMRALVVPGSQPVKEQAESEGLAKVFEDAGFEWREPGCSMCIAMNGDMLDSGQACASTSNRNFKGRQGKGGRTFLVSPPMAAAAALAGELVDVREWS